MSLSSNLVRVSHSESVAGHDGLSDDEARRRRYLRRYVVSTVAAAAGICVVAGIRVTLTRTDVATHPSDVTALHRAAPEVTASEPAQPASATRAPLIASAQTTSDSASASARELGSSTSPAGIAPRAATDATSMARTNKKSASPIAATSHGSTPFHPDTPRAKSQGNSGSAEA